jgi:hypothetical protein
MAQTSAAAPVVLTGEARRVYSILQDYADGGTPEVIQPAILKDDDYAQLHLALEHNQRVKRYAEDKIVWTARRSRKSLDEWLVGFGSSMGTLEREPGLLHKNNPYRKSLKWDLASLFETKIRDLFDNLTLPNNVRYAASQLVVDTEHWIWLTPIGQWPNLVGGNKWPSLTISPKPLHVQKRSAFIIEVGSSRDGVDLAKETMQYIRRAGVLIVIAINLPPLNSGTHDAMTGLPHEASYTMTVPSIVGGQKVLTSTKSVFWRSDCGVRDGQLTLRLSDFYLSAASPTNLQMHEQQNITIS